MEPNRFSKKGTPPFFFKKWKRPLFVLAVLFSGCGLFSHKVEPRFPSYRYDLYYLQNGEDLEDVSQAFGIPLGILKAINNKNQDEIRVPFITEVFPLFNKKIRGVKRPKKKALWPVLGGTVSSWFGKRDGKPHTGLDIRAPEGAWVFAAHDGRIVYAGNKGDDYGEVVTLLGKGYATRYAHLSKILVDKGDYVEQGEPIALVGMTGNATGPHLHFEYTINGEKYDPIALYTK